MDVLAEIRREAERLEEDVLYAEKQHFSMATIWRRIHFWLGVPSALCAALAGVSALNSLPGVAATLAIISAVLTALLTFLDPEKIGSAHHSAGVAYSALRGKLRRLRLIRAAEGAPTNGLKEEIEELAAEKSTIMKSSPHIGGLAYRLAKASIMRGEHEHAVDGEAPPNPTPSS